MSKKGVVSPRHPILFTLKIRQDHTGGTRVPREIYIFDVTPTRCLKHAHHKTGCRNKILPRESNLFSFVKYGILVSLDIMQFYIIILARSPSPLPRSLVEARSFSVDALFRDTLLCRKWLSRERARARMQLLRE